MKSTNPSLQAESGLISGHKVLRNTYLLLSMTLIFSGLMAAVSMWLNLPPFGMIITLVGYFGLLFLTTKFSDSALGLVFVFIFTGFMGLTLGPILNAYLTFLPNGAAVITTALAGTGVIFLGLSAYALISQKDFSFMGGFLMVGILVAFLAGLGAIFFAIPALSLAVSAMFILLMSGMILYQTSEILHGGETNYILATISLYIAIYNLFLSLLHILGALSGDD